MSGTYIQRLRTIRDEYSAARNALAYVTANWHQAEVIRQLGVTPRKDFDDAALNLEITYFIWLFAEFEGILKDHLATNHSRVTVPDNPKVDWLMSRVMRAESLTIDAALRRQIDLVRSYRNAIAHRS